MKIVLIFSLALSFPLNAKEDDCNKVAIPVSASVAYYAGQEMKGADKLYGEALRAPTDKERNAKLKEAITRYKKAYQLIAENRAFLVREIMDKQCEGVLTPFASPAPVGGGEGSR